MNPRWTAAITAVILPALGLMDYLFYWIGGNPATISAVLLAVRANFVSVIISVAYAFGMFLTHVSMPSGSKTAPSEVEILARAIVAFSPIFSAIVIVFTTGGKAGETMESMTDPIVQLKLAAALLVALIVGGIVGRGVFPQHPFAGVPL